MENGNTNFCHVGSTTFDEKLKMYMKCKKKQLAEMLAMRDLYDDIQKNGKPSEQFHPNTVICKSWSDCKNPQYDCIDCPLRSGIPTNRKNLVY